jgi:hypothetical protein
MFIEQIATGLATTRKADPTLLLMVRPKGGRRRVTINGGGSLTARLSRDVLRSRSTV